MVVHPATQDIGFAVRRRVAGFLSTLRHSGFHVGLAESCDALAILANANIARPSAAKPALKALLCGCRSDWDRFDDLFDAFWFGRGVKSRVQTTPSRGPVQPSAFKGPHGRNDGAQTNLASDVERRADEREFEATPDAMAEAHALAERLARTMRTRLTRRDRLAARGRRIDLRRTIRASLPTGGTPIHVVHKRRRFKPLRLVVLLDASGSMNLYTAVFVRFVHGILDHFLEADAFLFHTSLVHVSDALREKDAGKALDRLSLMAKGVGGGTRIGDSLASFNRWHAARVIHSRTCVMILSDGYDTGAPDVLGAEMAVLRRRCKRIVWLNPLIGWDGYEPSARGMAAALPYVDLFAPAHSLDSLAAIEPYLAQL
jgi:uncharacterized protein with von Willebrand factor type A (vWA) domain